MSAGEQQRVSKKLFSVLVVIVNLGADRAEDTESSARRFCGFHTAAPSLNQRF